ncbi:coiled-coil domain-containing protein 113 [Xyrichtys novacula]|uniref:Coiled-coil domain-containing protein 113 n=1 Tax=Xyrichtys novacula TaxID=13765 RepID=A0AAV1F7V0_XYRNO|nr:coiled-coil domain-containing protein 113 [Xyrichtys novacula]
MQQNPRNKAGVVCTLATMERELSLMEEKGKGVTEEEREDLFKRVQELKCSNAVLLAEIDLFERFISHTDSQYLQSQGVGNGPDTPRGSKLGDGITQLERYHFKNKALKVQQKKIQQQLLQRRDAVKADYEIIFQEFDEPKIEKNLDELQASYLKVTRILNSQKGALQSVTQESTELSSDITNREQILARIEEKIQRAQEECLKAEALNQNLRRQIADYQAPSIMEYVHIKNKHKMLQQSIHTWERKVEVTEMAMKVHSRAWNTQRATFTPANSAEAGAGSGQHRIPVKLPHIVEHST